MKLLHENFEFDDDFSRFVLLDKNTQEQIAADESFEYIVRLALKYQGRGKEVIIKDTETDEIIPEEEIDQWLQDYVNSTSTDITGETDDLMIKDLMEDTKTVNDAIDEFKREYGNSIDSETGEKAIEDMSRAETYWDAKDIGSIYTNLNFYRFKDTDEIVKHAGVRTVRKGKQSVYTQGDREYPTEHARDKDSIYFDSKLAEPHISKILKKINLTESYASKLSRKELEDTIWEVLDQCIAYSIADTFYMDTHLDPEFDSLDDKSDEDLRWIVDELNKKGYLDQQFYEDQEAGIDWEPNKYIMREAKEKNIGNKIAQLLADDIGYHGSFAENEVIPNGNVLELESQGPTEIYRFNDDGSVDFVNIEEAVSGWIEEGEIDEDEGDFMIEEYAHFDSVLDLIGGGLSWFMNISDDTIEAIKKVLKVK